jgi:hypothetical protein
LGLSGCAATGEGGKGVPDAGSRTYARLAITLTSAREDNLTIGTSARLLRYRGVDLDSAQLLAGTSAAGREAAGVAGRCTALDEEALLDDALATAPPDATVQMLDAGELLVHVAGQMVKLSPRHVPDIVPFVTGVAYDAEIAPLEPVDWPGAGPGSDAREGAFIAAFGGPQVGRFVAPAEVPAAPRVSSATYERGGDVTLTWSAEPARGGPLSVVLAAETGAAVRCLVEDSGHFVIPAALTARVADAGPLTLALERTRRTPFSAPGLDGAEVEITARDVVTLK